MKGTAAAPPRSRGAAPAAAAVRATVADANLCRTLSTASWRCDPADRQVPAGQLFFYTRIKSPAAATIEHRWYRGDRLERVVALRIQPNQRSGFRTFSRTAVKPGNWRVELRTRGGPVLHEEHFVVR